MCVFFFLFSFFWVADFGLSGSGFGFLFVGFGFRVMRKPPVRRVSDSYPLVRVSCFIFRVQGFGFRVSSSRFRLSGVWFLVSGFKFRVQGSGGSTSP